jgi:hypothetical protein
MPQCPQCNKPLVELTRQCPSCRADLDLLVDYVQGLAGSLDRAEQLTRAGQLGLAVWTYLQILEVDPDNPQARRQVGQVANSVRQFDRTVPGRRWAQGLPPVDKEEGPHLATWVKGTLVGLVVLMAFVLGFLFGQGGTGDDAKPSEPPKAMPEPRKDQQLGPVR